MRKAASRQDTMSTVKMCRKQSISAAAPTIWRNICGGKGYITDFTGKHWKIRLPQYEHFTRLDTLDERWTPEHIQRTMGSICFLRKSQGDISPIRLKCRRSLRDWFKPFQKTSHIYRLYLHYCYLLGVPAEEIPTYKPHKSISQRGFEEAGRTVRAGAVYE